jgi:hypothetical protein
MAAAAATELPEGTAIEIRLKSKVASNKSKPGDAVQAIVLAPVVAGGQMVIPAGSVIQGKVTEATAAREGERAGLAIKFGELAGAGQKAVKFAAKITAVDNARETVDDKGRIVGILKSETLSAQTDKLAVQIDKGVAKLGEQHQELASILEAAKGAFLPKTADVDIVYEPGVEMTLELTKKLPFISAVKAACPSPGPIADEDELAALADREPFQTMAEKPSKPSDITNLMFIGSKKQLEAAFTAAGWATAEALNSKSGLETFRAIAENRGYSQAPVSTLLLDGEKPSVVFQKQNDTFAKRHHIRIWQRPDTFAGQPVWVAAGTHDIDIQFSAQNRTFIHKIDSEIDRERAKVVSDLLLTGQVKGLALVERPAAPQDGENATGDQIKTDGSMAVLLLGGAPGSSGQQ